MRDTHKACFKGGTTNHIAAEIEKFCPVEACKMEWSTKYRRVHTDFYILYFLLHASNSSREINPRNRSKIGTGDIGQIPVDFEISNKRVQTRGGKGKKWQTGGPKGKSANERSEPRIVSGSIEANTAQLHLNTRIILAVLLPHINFVSTLSTLICFTLQTVLIPYFT